MKKTKNVLALILALMMAFSAMTMPAMAAGDEGVMPLAQWGICPDCNGAAEITYQGTNKDLMRIRCVEVGCGYDSGWVRVK